jgi:hypothetical protein
MSADKLLCLNITLKFKYPKACISKGSMHIHTTNAHTCTIHREHAQKKDGETGRILALMPSNQQHLYPASCLKDGDEENKEGRGDQR